MEKEIKLYGEVLEEVKEKSKVVTGIESELKEYQEIVRKILNRYRVALDEYYDVIYGYYPETKDNDNIYFDEDTDTLSIGEKFPENFEDMLGGMLGM